MSRLQVTAMATNAFVTQHGATEAAFAQLDAAFQYLKPHLHQRPVLDLRDECRAALTALKDTVFSELKRAVAEGEWPTAARLYHCLQMAAGVGHPQERQSVISRLEAVQTDTCTALDRLVESARDCLGRQQFENKNRLASNALSWQMP